MGDVGKTRSRDSVANTFIVAIGVSLVCSVLVASTAVLLKPRQEQNEADFQRQIVLEVAGLWRPDASPSELFRAIETRIVDLESGDYADGIDPDTFDAADAASDPQLGVTIPEELDTALVRRRARYAPVYIVNAGDTIDQVVLPVHGAGLWSTMYGFLALEPDGNTVRGLRFYEHAETPGLGDQIEKPDWLELWPGRRIFDANGSVRIEVIRGQRPPGDAGIHQVDGMSGATLTGRGVTNMLHYWTGPHGFGPYLEKLRREASGND